MSEPNRRARILIADDDAVMRDILREFLETDYECATARSAEEALALLAADGFDLILSDIKMGGMSGLEMLPHVLGLSPGTVVVMISGASSVDGALDAIRAGAFDYVVKPFDLLHVGVAVRRALEHRALVEAKRRYDNYLEEMIGRRTAELDSALDSLEGSYRQTLKALVAALETRDQETHGHSERVVSFSLRLGRELGLDDARLRDLEFGALLHDIGKIGVPDSVLRKPARLTDAEWEKMRQHPSLGRQILGGIEFLEGAALVVAQHHERWDGSGYPSGLKGEEIDLNARIFAVADAFDAMVSDRVYRRGRPYEEAARELEEFAGSQFDPTVVKAFLRVPAGEWAALRARSPTRPAPCRTQARASAEMVLPGTLLAV